MRKLLISLFVTLTLTLMLALPNARVLADRPAADHTSLIDAANELTARMLAVGGDEQYVQMLSLSGQLADEISAALAFDHARPTHHVLLKLPEDGVDRLWRIVCGGQPSDAVRETLAQKLLTALPGSLNSRWGTAWLAASSVLAVTDVALLPDVGPGGYLVFTVYGEDAPLLCVSAMVKADGLSIMNAAPVRADDALRAALLDGTLADMAGQEGVGVDPMLQTLLSGVMCEVYAAEGD